jgi:hypothetical protein
MSELPPAQSEPQPKPIISPDGRYYWNGAEWIQLPTATLPNPPAQSSNATVILIVCLVVGVLVCGFGFFLISHKDFQVAVEDYTPGKPDISGWIENDGSACSDPRITLTMRDHNGAIVDKWEFGAGELASGQRKEWRTHMTSIGVFDHNVPDNTSSIDAEATCADQH